jgi:hypothetical protein
MLDDLFAANDNNDDIEADFWKGLDIHLLPNSPKEAASLGIKFFFTGEECVHGHLAPKYTAGGRCVTCARYHAAAAQGGRFAGSFTAARANIKRAIASMSMNRTYTPIRPCKHGHMLRYISSNNCVECSDLQRIKHKETVREKRLIRLYGIDFADQAKMADEQNRKCGICQEDFTDNRAMHVDHCHTTGKVRGLLCALCNQAIGLLKEDVEILHRAVEYIQRHAVGEAA